MQTNEKRSGKFWPKVLVWGFLTALFVLVSLFPFYYQTQTLWYKVGIDRTLLIAGQIAGLYTACLVLLQLILIIRLPGLTRIFGAPTVVSAHRINGKIIPFAALSHVLLVLVPEGIGNLPIGMKYWPEMTGILAFLLLFLLAVSNWLRVRLALPYPKWKIVHRLSGLSAFLCIGVHIAFVSDAFRQTAPAVYLLILFISVLLTYSYGKWRQNR